MLAFPFENNPFLTILNIAMKARTSLMKLLP